MDFPLKMTHSRPFSRIGALLFAASILMAAPRLSAQESGTANAPFGRADSTSRDSVSGTASAEDSAARVLASIPLLPEVMSPGEKIMWGKRGLMRITGAFPLTEESRERELGLRRTMLTVHQVAGFATLASMIATVTYGQLTLNGHTSLGETHQTLAAITIGSYFFTAAMSLLSPPPMIRRKEWSTISIHKGLAMVHFSGMILTPLLAEGIAREERGAGKDAIDRDKAHVHQVSGYITTAAFAAAMMVVTF
ncbi:MAG: hypothetical protein JWP91_3717 [Fibrobacteres bacterium]|nr:hypothetical protein [Fibrobacterota bacterium]